MWRDPFDIQFGGPIVQSSSDLAAEEPTPQTGFLENLRATREEMRIAGNTNALTENERDAYQPLLEALEAAGERWADGRHFLNPADLPEADQPTRAGLIPSRSATKQALFEALRRRRQVDPGFAAGIPDSVEAFEAQVRERNAARLQRIRGVQAGASGLGQVGGFVGGVLGSIEDPLNFWTLPFGGGARTLVGAMARSAGENMLIETVAQPFVARNYGELGEDYGVSEGVRSVLFAGGLGAGIRGAGEGAVRLGRSAGPALEELPARIFEIMPEGVRERWSNAATIDDQLLADAIRAASPEEAWSPDVKAAVNVLEREAEVRAASPFEATPQGDDAHAEGLAAALQRLIDGAPRPAARPALLSSTAPIAAPPARPRGAAGELDQDALIRFVINDLEGGAAVVRYSEADGGTTKYGIAAKFNQGVDVASLTERQAIEIAKRDYWFEGLDQAPRDVAAVAFDAGFISGPKVGARILAASGGNAERALALYRAHLNRIADTIPGKAKYRRGWNNRVDKLARKLGLEGNGRAEPMAELADLGEARAAGDAAEELAELEAIDLARSSEGPELEARPDGPEFEPVPILKRELFGSDRQWIEAQLALGRSIDGQMARAAAVEASPAREAPVAAAAQPDLPPALERAVRAGAVVDQFGDGSADFLVGERVGKRMIFWSSRDRQTVVTPGAGGRERSYPDPDGELFSRELATAKAREPITIGELKVLRPRQGSPDPLWLVASAHAHAREQGRQFAPFGIRDRESGELLRWSTDRKEIDKVYAELGSDRASVDILDAGNVAMELRSRAEREAAAAAVTLDAPALERFADPDGEGVKAQVESLEHDLRMDAADPVEREADPLDPGPEPPRPRHFAGAVAELLREKSRQTGIAHRIDADDAISHGVEADAIYVNPKARYPSVKVHLAGIFAPSRSPLRSKAKPVKLHKLDYLGDQFDPLRFGLADRADGGRLEPADVAELLSASLRRSDDVLDRADPRFEPYAEWLARGEEATELEAMLSSAQARSAELVDSHPARTPDGRSGTHNIANSAPVAAGGTRGELRVRVVQQLLATPARADREAHLVLGPPAAGKSTLSDRVAAAAGARIIDSDDAKALLPEFEAGVGAAAVHEESARLAALAADETLRRGENMVLPLIGKTYDGVAARIDELAQSGYSVYIHLVDLPTDKAVARAVRRFAETGRLVDPEYVRSVGDKPRDTFARLLDAYQGKIGGYAHVSNDVPIGEPPRLVAASDEATAARFGFARAAKPGDGAGAPRGAPGRDDGGAAEPGLPGELEPTYRLDPEGPELTDRELLEEIEAEDRFVETLRGCLNPGAGEG